ncbi:MAG: 6-hydroxymethylpterin diphosphokinase MptE-like protein [Phycisphaerales bacterium]
MTTNTGAERPADPALLSRNLAAIARRSPIAARAIAASPGREGAAFLPAPDGGLTGTITDAGVMRRLASAHRPIEEGKRLADTIAIEGNAASVVLGFGLGHHCRALAERLRFTGVIVAYEPDIGLLREVLSRVDHSDWIVRTNFVLLTDPDDAGAIAAGMSGVEGLVVLGTRLIEHPASQARLGASADRFAARLAEVVRSVRTTVMTTMVQSPITLRNLVMNADYYAACPGIADLSGAAKGRPAIVVAAGPSLHRNIEELSRPGVRDKFVIIAVQTVLKTLLERGIRPHFVTALDHADLSARFYEGLSEEDVEGVTLVVEAKANASILEAFPGEVRVAGEPLLDTMLGAGFARERGEITPGATVAHMAYYLARHLGCDPVVLVGQDLGFTDGQYYHAHAAIHRVWSNELNDFNTLEMLEWQRIVRSRSMLHRATDLLGRSIYADEQMTTYLAQFERDFLHDAQRGLSVVDATEGGVRKRHTSVMTLRAAIEKLAGGAVELPRARGKGVLAEVARERLVSRLREVRQEAGRIEVLSDQTAALLDRLARALDEPRKANKIIGEVYELRDQVHACAAGLALVQFVNQTGSLNRFRADRAIELEGGLSELEKQKRRVARDTTNVRWIAEAARHVGELLDRGIEAHRGGAKLTRERAPDVEVTREAVRVVAHVHVDAARGGLGTARDLSAPIAGGKNALQLTLARLARSRRLDGVVITSDDPDRARTIAGSEGQNATFVKASGRTRRPVEIARLTARRSWRGGLGNASVFDEVFDPVIARAAIGASGAAAIAPVGADWALVDSAMIDACIERHEQNPAAMSLVFTPAAPGLATCVVGAALAAELAEKGESAGVFGTIGALLGYIPIAPQADPIARSACVPAIAPVRDCTERLIGDTPAGVEALRWVMHELGARGATASAELVVSTLATRARAYAPEVLTLSLTGRRRTGGLRSSWLGEPGSTGLAFERAIGAIDTFMQANGDRHQGVVVSLEGAGDPLLYSRWREVVAHARAAGAAAIHLRTELLCDPHTLELVRDAGLDVLSVDLLADRGETYQRVTGLSEHGRAVENIESLLAARGEGRGPTWIVPRITRCDEVYEEIEAFYDRWIMRAGWCVIDPMPRAMEGARIAPLPRPACIEARDLSTRAFVEAIPGVFPLTPAQAAELIEQKATQHEPAA